jgi:RNA polymerase sigma-70 factor, ECF subfamily
VAPPSLPIEEQDALVAALKQGSEEAFEQLYAALHGRIYNLAARVVGDADDAADIMQEVFIKAFTGIPAHQGDLRLEPWLFRVAVNTCYDHLRRRNVRSALPLDDIGEVADACDEYERSQMSSAVSSALQRISPRYRTALVLKDLQGFGNAEVAEALGVSQGTTNVLLFRARSAFKRAFREISPAGSGRLTALGLAAYLPELPVPEALQAAPDFTALSALAASLAPAAGPLAHSIVPLATSTLPATEAGAGLAASTGVLAKIGGAVGAKVAMGVLGVTALTGGSLAVHQAQSTDASPTSARTTAVSSPADALAPPVTGLGATAEIERHRYLQDRQGAKERPPAHGTAVGGESNGQGAPQAGPGGGQNGAAASGGGGGHVAAGGAARAGSGQPAGTGSGSGAGAAKGPASAAGASAQPAGAGTGPGATTAGNGGSSQGSQQSGAGAL